MNVMIYLGADHDQNDLVNFNYFTIFLDQGNIAEVLQIGHEYIRSKLSPGCMTSLMLLWSVKMEK